MLRAFAPEENEERDERKREWKEENARGQILALSDACSLAAAAAEHAAASPALSPPLMLLLYIAIDAASYFSSPFLYCLLQTRSRRYF